MALTELHVVDTMHQRKQAFTDLSDGFVTLPGGTGTMDELWEAMSWAQLGYHAKPVGLLNTAGFYDELLAFVATMGRVGFLRPQHQGLLLHDCNAGRAARPDGGISAGGHDRADRRRRPVSDRAALVAAGSRVDSCRLEKFLRRQSRLFDRATRERAWLLYAWCRACDDIADGQVLGHGMTAVADVGARVERMAALTERALAGDTTGEMPFDALRQVVAETNMPPRFARDLIQGFCLDAEEWRPRSEADLYRYCYHVAGAVGCMMAVVMGVSPDDENTLDRACDLGIAFQLANIARDIEEDDRVGRCYLPVDWLVEMDFPPGQHMKPPFRRRLAVLSRRLARQAACYRESSRAGAAMLPFRSAWAVLAAGHIYGAIAEKVAARGEHAWDHRVTTSGAEKLGFIARAWSEALRRKRYAGRARDAGLWRRPR